MHKTLQAYTTGQTERVTDALNLNRIHLAGYGSYVSPHAVYMDEMNS